MPVHRIIGNILIALSAALTAVNAAVMLRRIRRIALKKPYAALTRHQLPACGVFLLLALDIRFGLFTFPDPPALKFAGWGLRAGVVLISAVILFFMIRVSAACPVRRDGPTRHAVVLGLALENGRPVRELISRLDTAEKYLSDHTGASLILTGGNPGPDGRTEAQVMGDLLTARGVPPEALIKEDRAADTIENFRNTARLTDPEKPVTLITSGYHMFRALRLARAAGFRAVLPLPSPSDPRYFIVNILSEALLEIRLTIHDLKARRGR